MPLLSDRRKFLKTAVLTGTAAAIPAQTVITGNVEAAQDSKPSKGLEYARMIRGMVQNLLAQDSSKIEQAGDLCAEALASGKKVYYNTTGHNEPQCIMEKRAGKPSFLIPLYGAIDYTIFKPGDVFITERINFCAPAKEKGVKLIGILMPFQAQKKQGQGIVYVDYKGPWMEEICDVCIWDRVPFTIGTMSFDQLPFKAVPAHGAMDGIILNLILAATIDRLVKKGIPVEATVEG
ncbi:MAG: hypothetical protein WCU00_08485 [Candidatus Latescibacterota bacterium]